ncbi:MAG: nitronate monooxygenase [Gemmatimonadota bacterium]
MRTPLCDLLGIDVPIIQAPIGSASCPELVAAVAEAGGLGLLAASWLTPDQLRSSIRRTRTLTSRPFGVNLVLAWPQEDRLRIALDEGVGIVSFAWGDPEPYLARVRSGKGRVLHSVGSAEEARAAGRAGVDAIVAQGWEAGGHVRGDVALSVLVPAVCDAVGSLPVIAAGGVADGRGLVSALALGAQAVWMGTRFLASTEARVHPIYQEHLIAAVETSTAHTLLFDGGWPDAPHRTLRNSTVRLWEQAGRPLPPNRPGEGDAIAGGPDGAIVLRYDDTIPVTGSSGDVEALAMYAGQTAGLIHEVLPAAEIIRRTIREAGEVLGRIHAY